MPDFMPVSINDNTFIRGAARFMWAGTTVTFPTVIGDVVNLSTYLPATGWNDLGATKTGVTITVNNTEETFDVDQITGDIDSRPNNWEVTVNTSLAEVDLTHMQFAWQGGDITGTTTTIVGVGNPTVYLKRRLAVLHQKANGFIRAHVFRKAQRAPQESSLVYAKTGEQQQLPVSFRALADTSIATVNERIFMTFDQQS